MSHTERLQDDDESMSEADTEPEGEVSGDQDETGFLPSTRMLEESAWARRRSLTRVFFGLSEFHDKFDFRILT